MLRANIEATLLDFKLFVTILQIGTGTYLIVSCIIISPFLLSFPTEVSQNKQFSAYFAANLNLTFKGDRSSGHVSDARNIIKTVTFVHETRTKPACDPLFLLSKYFGN